MKFHLVVKLTQTEAQRLSQPVRGVGGFQSLLRYLKRHRLGARTTVAKGKWIERLLRYRQYGSGGFEARLGRR